MLTRVLWLVNVNYGGERASQPYSQLLFIVEITVRSLQPFLDVVSGCDDGIFRRPILRDA